MKTTTEIGQIVKEHRQGLGLSQEELADRLGISQARISQIENGAAYPNYKVLSKLHKAGLNLANLFEESETDTALAALTEAQTALNILAGVLKEDFDG